MGFSTTFVTNEISSSFLVVTIPCRSGSVTVCTRNAASMSSFLDNSINFLMEEWTCDEITTSPAWTRNTSLFTNGFDAKTASPNP